jgi:hypothetical protein
MTDDNGIEFCSYSVDSPLLEDALAVYARVWPDRDQDVARESFTRYARYDDFHGMVAFLRGQPIGVGYGARSYPGVWWHDQVAARLGNDFPPLQDAWRLVELAVVSEFRQQQVGGRIHDRLIAARTCARALLCTGTTNVTAQTMYARRGWYTVHPGFDFPGESHPYVIMGKELRHP